MIRLLSKTHVLIRSRYLKDIVLDPIKIVKSQKEQENLIPIYFTPPLKIIFFEIFSVIKIFFILKHC